MKVKHAFFRRVFSLVFDFSANADDSPQCIQFHPIVELIFSIRRDTIQPAASVDELELPLLCVQRRESERERRHVIHQFLT